MSEDIDIDIQGERKFHERLALIHMDDRYHGLPAIFIAERGYSQMEKEFGRIYLRI